MSFEAVKWAWDQWDRDDITCPQKILLMALANHADEEGKCFPRQATLARKTSLKRQAANRNLGALEDLGLLEIIRNFRGDGSQGTNTYRLRMEGGCTPGVQGGVPLGDTLRDKHRESEPVRRESSLHDLIETHGSVRVKAREAPPDPPEWLEVQEWEGFLDHRRGMKSPMTPHAQRLLIGRLEELRSEGHDATKCLRTAVLNGWKTVYPPKPERQANNGNGKPQWEPSPDSPAGIRKRNKEFFRSEGLDF